MRFALTLLILIFFTACQTHQKRVAEFNKLEVGMVKSEVIAIAGAPYWSDRKRGQDRWIYYMNPKDREDERIIYFENNKVVKKGLRDESLFSAEEIEDIKSQRINKKPYQRKLSDKELEGLIQQEIKKSEKQIPEKFEKI